MIKTKLIHIDKNNINIDKLKEAANILKEDGTVAFPTETVYGLGANAFSQSAIEKIFKAKGRPSDNPLIIHVSRPDDIKELVLDIPKKAKLLMEEFWPGPLTMIFEKSDLVPHSATGGLNTVAIRIPSHEVARKLIELSGVPVAAPSANLSGKPSPTKESHVIEDLMDRVDAIVCGGDSSVGVESTVLDMTSDTPMILRPGGVTKEQLEIIIENIEIDPGILKNKTKELVPKSPGMKYTHYSPKAEVVLIDGKLNDMINIIEKIRKQREKEGCKIGIMATNETKNSYLGGTVISLGSRSKLETVANNLFRVLREFDEKKVDIILAETFEEKGLGQAVMNRLIKAAGYNVIKA